jgi:hypothetical protein
VKFDVRRFGATVSEWLKATGRRLHEWIRKLRVKPQTELSTVDEPDLAAGSMFRASVRPGHPAPIHYKSKPIRRRSREKVYRLRGYTTIAKVNRKRQSERQQRFLRRVLIFIIVVLIVILLFNLYNPIKDLTEWYRIIGIKDISDLTSSTTTLPGTITTHSATTTVNTQPSSVGTTTTGTTQSTTKATTNKATAKN